MSNNLNSRCLDVLPIYETFYAFQGEGAYIGCAAYFIRTYGCPVRCEWCDSANTWKSNIETSTFQEMDVEFLANKAKNSGAQIVVITGGEPTIYNLNSLTKALHEKGLRVHLETCGAFPIKGDFDWITVSPKWKALPLPENIRMANELKVIVEDDTSIEKWWRAIENYFEMSEDNLSLPKIWLQPEYKSLLGNPHLLDSITKHVKSNPLLFRAGIQLHKIYNCDDLDQECKNQ